MTRPRRCFVCAADMLAPSTRRLDFPGGRRRAFPVGCGFCGVLIAPEADRTDAGGISPGGSPRRSSSPTRRRVTASTSTPCAAPRPASAAASAPSARRTAPPCCSPTARAAEGALYDLDGAERRPVSLGVICRPAERASVLAALPAQAAWAADVAILLDAAPAPAQAVAVPASPPAPCGWRPGRWPGISPPSATPCRISPAARGCCSSTPTRASIPRPVRVSPRWRRSPRPATWSRSGLPGATASTASCRMSTRTCSTG
ncbi:hypothetical protein MBRA_03666 [Methylobacterium brachiatum]|nr:hypothetical protein MBRA_03666 [Methylobacterium brachiatum]